MPTIVDLICDASERCSNRPAVFAGGQHHTYAELVAKANGIVEILSQSDYADEQRIGIVTADDFATYASLLAIMCSGKAYVPLNRTSPPPRNLAVAEQAGLNVVLSSAKIDECETAAAVAQNHQVIHTAVIDSSPGRLRRSELSADDMAYLFFTSGSTGVPKGVPIQHSHLYAFMHSVIFDCGYELSADDRFLQMFEMTFDLSVMSIFAPWCLGACCCVVPEEGIAYLNIIDILEKQKVTVALMVPSALAYMRRFFGEISLPDLRISLFCGEALYHDLVSDWAPVVPNAHIENVYGPTEATIFCLRYVWQQDESAKRSVNGIVPIGQPMPGIGAIVVDEAGKLCEPGEKGELCLTGSQVMDGYWNDPAKTDAAFLHLHEGEPERAYRTGDIAYADADGTFIYLGRLDSQVKIDGHRIELAEIEHFARQRIGDSMAAAIVRDDEFGRPTISLYLQKGDFDINEIGAYLATELPPYMRPRQVTVLDKMPLNLNGKIDRKKLAAMSD